MAGLTRKLLLGLVFVIVAAASTVAVMIHTSNGVAGAAADKYMATATDGPWDRSKARLGLYLFEGPETPTLSLIWAFRYRQRQTGGESRRIYATFLGDHAWSNGVVLDPVPVLGFRP